MPRKELSGCRCLSAAVFLLLAAPAGCRGPGSGLALERSLDENGRVQALHLSGPVHLFEKYSSGAAWRPLPDSRDLQLTLELQVAAEPPGDSRPPPQARLIFREISRWEVGPELYFDPRLYLSADGRHLATIQLHSKSGEDGSFYGQDASAEIPLGTLFDLASAKQARGRVGTLREFYLQSGDREVILGLRRALEELGWKESHFVRAPLPGAGPALPLISAAPAGTADWPQWRGPDRDGVWRETGILTAFPAGGLKVLWRAPVGVGFSSPIVSGGRVYLTDSELVRPRARERVQAFDVETGRPLWTHAYEVDYQDWAFDEKSPRGPTATPLVRDGRLYTLGSLGHLFAFDASGGAILWQRDLAKDYPGKELQCSASPLLEGDLLVVQVGAKPGPACLLAFDRNTGKEVWKALDESPTHASPIVVTAAGVRQLIVWTQESVTSLDPATGRPLWRRPLESTADYVVSTPVFRDPLLLLGGLMLKLDSSRPGVASVLWPESRSVSRRILSNTSTACLQGEHLFSARSSGELVCLEAATGKKVWESDQVTRLGNGASIHLTPSGGLVFLFNDRGELTLARLTAEGYQEISRAALLEPTYPFGGRKVAWAPPAYADRKVFARSDRELVCASLAQEP